MTSPLTEERFEDAVATVMRWAERAQGRDPTHEQIVREIITEIQNGKLYTETLDHDTGECHVCDAQRVLRLLAEDDWWRD